MDVTSDPGRPLWRARSLGAAANIERFWPSRRGHAFDEFCR